MGLFAYRQETEFKASVFNIFANCLKGHEFIPSPQPLKIRFFFNL